MHEQQWEEGFLLTPCLPFTGPTIIAWSITTNGRFKSKRNLSKSHLDVHLGKKLIQDFDAVARLSNTCLLKLGCKVQAIVHAHLNTVFVFELVLSFTCVGLGDSKCKLE